MGSGFGALAQRCKFCLRAATIEFSERRLGPQVAIWVLAFSGAVMLTQMFIALGLMNTAGARQIADRGSISGAVIGGLMFGAGMILARGCASRLLVLSGTGNLRAIVSGLILTVVAQASLRGVLAPIREGLSNLWVVDGGTGRDILAWAGGSPRAGVSLGLVWIALGVWLARRNNIGTAPRFEVAGVGATVALGWLFTYSMGQTSFEPVRMTSVTFTGPSADTLMGLINSRVIPLTFDTGLVPGVFLGSLLAALRSGEFQLKGFESGSGMLRYLVGAPLMGFGGMLAGGCAVGAGVTGGSIFALTGWLALAAMWAGAVVTNLLVDANREN